jgi:hypothetical protein
MLEVVEASFFQSHDARVRLRLNNKSQAKEREEQKTVKAIRYCDDCNKRVDRWGLASSNHLLGCTRIVSS